MHTHTSVYIHLLAPKHKYLKFEFYEYTYGYVCMCECVVKLCVRKCLYATVYEMPLQNKHVGGDDCGRFRLAKILWLIKMQLSLLMDF